MEDRDRWKQAAGLSAGATKKALESINEAQGILNTRGFSAGGIIAPKDVQVAMLRAGGATYQEISYARKDWTKDRPGDYSPLPNETPEQLVARLDAQNVRDWDAQWQKLTGKTWAQHQRDVTVGEMEDRRRAAKNVHMRFDPETREWQPKNGHTPE